MRSHGPVINTDHVTAAERAVSVFHTDCTAPLFFLFQAIVFVISASSQFFFLFSLLHFLVAIWLNCLSFFVLYLFICHIFKRILILGGPFSFPPSSGTFPESITIFICLFGYASLCESTYTLGGRTGYDIFYLNQIFCITAPSGVTMHCKILHIFSIIVVFSAATLEFSNLGSVKPIYLSSYR